MNWPTHDELEEVFVAVCALRGGREARDEKVVEFAWAYLNVLLDPFGTRPGDPKPEEDPRAKAAMGRATLKLRERIALEARKGSGS